MGSGDLSFRRRWSGNAEVMPTDFKWNGRPLVVIDPDSLPMDDLLRGLDRWRQWTSLIREKAAVTALFDAVAAQVSPPKPDEPTGLGAVVEDAEGRRWIKIDRHAACNDWFKMGASGETKHLRTYYRDIAAVKVVSEGVTP